MRNAECGMRNAECGMRMRESRLVSCAQLNDDAARGLRPDVMGQAAGIEASGRATGGLALLGEFRPDESGLGVALLGLAAESIRKRSGPFRVALDAVGFVLRADVRIHSAGSNSGRLGVVDGRRNLHQRNPVAGSGRVEGSAPEGHVVVGIHPHRSCFRLVQHWSAGVDAVEPRIAAGISGISRISGIIEDWGFGCAESGRWRWN